MVLKCVFCLIEGINKEAIVVMDGNSICEEHFPSYLDARRKRKAKEVVVQYE